MGSPSALSDADLNRELRQAAHKYSRTLYVPSGALWGGQDIQRMSDSGKLKVAVVVRDGPFLLSGLAWPDPLLCFQGVFVRMSKHPSCFRLTGDALSDWQEGEGRRVLFSGSVAELCPLAPNNVNTMAAAAVAAGDLGFAGVRGEIVSDTACVPRLIRCSRENPNSINPPPPPHFLLQVKRLSRGGGGGDGARRLQGNHGEEEPGRPRSRHRHGDVHLLLEQPTRRVLLLLHFRTTVPQVKGEL